MAIESGTRLKNEIIVQLVRSPHGDLHSYAQVGVVAAKQEPEFLQHLIAWNQVKGQIRDSKVALPIISLTPGMHEEFAENALAHLGLLDPKNLLRALKFSKDIKPEGFQRRIYRLVERYLRVREHNQKWFDGTAMQHRKSLHELYRYCHIKPSAHADGVLFKGHKVGVFKQIAELGAMSPGEAAGVILSRKVPFLVAMGAMGKEKMSDPQLVLALIERMSPAELVNNSKMLERLGIGTVPALRAAYDEGLKRVMAAPAGASATLKATRALEATGTSEHAQEKGAAALSERTAERLRAVQEQQMKQLSVKGRWLVISDMSGSMESAIEAAVHIASTLAAVAESVHLVFVNTAPRAMDVTGKSLEEIRAMTKHIVANGGTDIGCGLSWLLEGGHEVDGIAIASDGGENRRPFFAEVYTTACKRWDRIVPVYLYELPGERNVLSAYMTQMGHDLQVFNLRGTTVDFYSLPNLVKTMRTNRFSLVDEIMAAPLVTLDEVFGRSKVAA